MNVLVRLYYNISILLLLHNIRINMNTSRFVYDTLLCTSVLLKKKLNYLIGPARQQMSFNVLYNLQFDCSFRREQRILLTLFDGNVFEFNDYLNKIQY